MAIVTPFGDPNAHGTIGNSISFRRRFGKVILEAKPNPVQPNSAAQIAQRSAFSSAQQDWYFYNAISKLYFNERAPVLNMTAKNLYTQAKLLNNMPSVVNIALTEITALQILSPICPNPTTGVATFQGYDSGGSVWKSLGLIRDNENSWVNQGPISGAITKFRINVNTSGYELFRYGFSLTANLYGGGTVNLIIRVNNDGTALSNLGISSDGSCFYDEALTQLCATNNF